MIVEQGGPSGPSGGRVAEAVFSNVYIGTAAAVRADALANVLRIRLVQQG